MIDEDSVLSWSDPLAFEDRSEEYEGSFLKQVSDWLWSGWSVTNRQLLGVDNHCNFRKDMVCGIRCEEIRERITLDIAGKVQVRYPALKSVERMMNFSRAVGLRSLMRLDPDRRYVRRPVRLLFTETTAGKRGA